VGADLRVGDDPVRGPVPALRGQLQAVAAEANDDEWCPQLLVAGVQRIRRVEAALLDVVGGVRMVGLVGEYTPLLPR
jgi:hypothetical protein